MKLPKLPKLSEVRKAAVAVAALAGEALSAGLLHGTAAHYVQVGLALLAAVGVYTVPNGSRLSGGVRAEIVKALDEVMNALHYGAKPAAVNAPPTPVSAVTVQVTPPTTTSPPEGPHPTENPFVSGV